MSALADTWWRLVRLGFRLLYYELSFTYDAVSQIVSLGQWRCWQRTVFMHLPARDAGMILELAHGTGNLQLDLRRTGYGTVGYDLSPNMGRIAMHKLEVAGYGGRLVRGQAQQLPFASAQFVAIVCTFPTNFIVAEQTLREMHRVLQPGGSAVIVLSGMLTGNTLPHRLIEWLYSITGQRDDEGIDTEDLFGGMGFEVRLIEETCSNSRVHLVHLRKLP